MREKERETEREKTRMMASARDGRGREGDTLILHRHIFIDYNSILILIHVCAYTCVQSYTLYNEQSKLSNSGRSGSSLSDPIMYTCELRIIPTLTVSSLLQISTTARGRKFWTPVWLELLWAMPASTMHTGGGRRTWRATSRAEDTGKGTLPRKMVKRKIVNSRIARGGRAHSPLPPTIQTRTQVGVSA